MPKPTTPIRVVIVDDSATMRELLASLLSAEGDIQVVGSAADGEEAVNLVRRLRPTLVTMDIHMPHMNGVEAIRQIMREHPLPIVIVTASSKPHEMELVFQGLRAGALTMVNKPGLNDLETSHKLIQAVRLMAGVPVIHHWGRNTQPITRPPVTAVKPRSAADLSPAAIQRLREKTRLVGIGASTGGPSAVAAVIRNLPADYPLPIVLVQHFSPGFAGGLAEWLSTQTRLQVEIAAHGDSLRLGAVFLAPDDYHLQVTRRGMVELSKGPPYKGLRPSANPMFESLAAGYGPSALGILLTGMGDDGADGMVALHKAGGTTFAQEAESCVVYGMPREAVERGGVDEVLTPEQIAAVLEQLAAPTPTQGGDGND